MSKKETFIGIVKQHKGILYKVITMYCNDDEDRKDLEQEILIQIWKSLDTYNSEYAITTWLYRIAMNVSISHYRKAFKEKTKMTRLDVSLLQDKTAPETAEESPQKTMLNKLLGQLNEFDKALMFLYLEDKDHEVIADVLGISKSNVGTKINRIKNKWKNQLKKEQL